MEHSKPKLSYFSIRGRGEYLRLILVTAGVDFEDHRIELAKWGESKGTTPFGQVPVYEDKEVGTLAQTHAIALYLGQKYKLVGSTPVDLARIWEVIETIRDCRDVIMPTVRDPKAKELIGEVLEKQLKPKIVPIQALLEKNGGEFFVGKELTLADLFVFECVDNYIKPLGHDLLKAFPALEKHRASIAAHPKIAEYIKTRRPKTTLPPFLHLLNTEEECA